MTQKVRRNDPCPCGSGKKYKKCCLAKEQEEDRRVHAAQGAQQRRNDVFMHVMEWLSRHHEEALQEAFEEFGTALVEDGRVLSEEDHDYLTMQTVEWVLAEGTAEVKGRQVRLRDLALESGPILEADQRRWFDLSTQEPLRLWQVTRLEEGVGLELSDLIDESTEAVWVSERSASRTLRRLDVIAGRLGQWQGKWELACVYAIPESDVLELLSQIENQVDGDFADPGVARSVGKLIRDYWVHSFTRIPAMPEVMTAGGDALELTTDHWQIIDRAEFERRLEAEPDVVNSGDRTWTRVEDPDAVMGRPLLALNPGKKDDRLESFALSRKLADEGRSWLEKVAGASLRLITREIVDPMSERNLGASGKAPAPGSSTKPFAFQATDAKPGQDSVLPPDVKSQLMETMYRQQYQGIADEVIPALGDKTPRDALKEPGGQSRVRIWLEGFDRNEERMAEAEGREPVDLSFVWRDVGLERQPD